MIPRYVSREGLEYGNGYESMTSSVCGYFGLEQFLNTPLFTHADGEDWSSLEHGVPVRAGRVVVHRLAHVKLTRHEARKLLHPGRLSAETHKLGKESSASSYLKAKNGLLCMAK